MLTTAERIYNYRQIARDLHDEGGDEALVLWWLLMADAYEAGDMESDVTVPNQPAETPTTPMYTVTLCYDWQEEPTQQEPDGPALGNYPAPTNTTSPFRLTRWERFIALIRRFRGR